MVLGTALAIIGIIVVIIGLLAVLGLSSIVPGEAVASGIQGAFSVFFNWWQLWAPLLLIAVVAYIAKGGRGSRGSAKDTVIGAAEGVTRGLRGDGGEPEPDPTPEPPTTTPPDAPDSDDDTSSRDDSQSQQQQQMQQMMMALLQGNLGQGDNGNFVSYGPQQQQQQQMFGGLSPGVYSMFMQQINMMQMNQQKMMQQMMQFMQQNNYQQIDNQFIIQFMEQVLDVDIDEGNVKKGDVIVQINQVIQQINITQIEQNIEKIVQEVNITNTNYIEQFTNILIAVKEGDIKKEGDVIVIFANQEIRINSATLLTFLNILQVIKYWELKQLLIALIDMSPDMNWEVKIEKLIIIYRESDDGKGEEDPQNRWGKIGQIIENSQLPKNFQDQLIALLMVHRSPDKINQLNLNQRKVYAVNKLITFPSNQEIWRIMRNLTSQLENQGYTKLDDNSLEFILNFLEGEINRGKASQTDLSIGSLPNNDSMPLDPDEIRDIIQRVKKDLQVDEQILEEDKELKSILNNIEKSFEEHRGVFMALNQVTMTNNKNPSPRELYASIQKLDQEINLDLSSVDGAHQMLMIVDNMREQIENLHSILDDEERLHAQVANMDEQMDGHLEDLDQNIQHMEGFTQKMENFLGDEHNPDNFK